MTKLQMRIDCSYLCTCNLSITGHEDLLPPVINKYMVLSGIFYAFNRYICLYVENEAIIQCHLKKSPLPWLASQVGKVGQGLKAVAVAIVLCTLTKAATAVHCK